MSLPERPDGGDPLYTTCGCRVDWVPGGGDPDVARRRRFHRPAIGDYHVVDGQVHFFSGDLKIGGSGWIISPPEGHRP